MTIIRSWREFEDLYGKRHSYGTVSWGRGLSGKVPVLVGDELTPFESVGSVVIVDDRAGVAMSIGVETFGTVKRVLVEEGAEVRPGQALMEFEERPPTLEEWSAAWERANRAENRARDLNELLENPGRAFLASVKGKLRRLRL